MADELDALRTINAHHGDLDAERAARMRARALAAVFADAAPDTGTATSTTNSTSVLTEPADERGPDAPRPAHAGRRRRPDRADHLVRLVPDGPTTEIHLDRPDEQDVVRIGSNEAATPSGRRPFAVAIAAAAVIALVIGFAVARSGTRDTVVADQPAPTTVAELAANAATLVDRPLAAGQFSYVAVERGTPFVTPDQVEETHVVVAETWASSTDEGRQRRSPTEVVDGGGTPVSTFDVATDTGRVPMTSAFGGLSYQQLRSLPSDPAALRAVLDNDERGPRTAYNRSLLITDLLTYDATPPAVRAAVLTILAEDGATLLPDAVDHEGRAGIGVMVERPDGFTSVYVVTRDGLLVGAYDIITGDQLTPERAVVWSSPRDQRRVDTAN